MSSHLEESSIDAQKESDTSFLCVVPTLGNAPIENCELERELIENRMYSQLCLVLYGSSFVIDGFPREILGPSMDARTVEVYRLCYDDPRKTKKQREKVLTALVSNFPELIFQADWFADVVRHHAKSKPSGTNNVRNGTFLAIANGFRGAAGRKSIKKSLLRRDLLWVPRMHCRELRDKLEQWQKSLPEWNLGEPGWKLEEARKKANQLVTEDRRLFEHADNLTHLLGNGQLYKAAVRVISITWDVPERDLEGERLR